MIWRQYIKIRDREVTHKLPLLEPHDLPPKDRVFIVFKLGEVGESNSYPIWKNNRLVDSLNINERKTTLEWVGKAKWVEEQEWFEITPTNSQIICIPELDQDMRFSTLPDSWTWSQPEYNIVEQQPRRLGFIGKLLKQVSWQR